MKKFELNVVKYNNEDVIATSGTVVPEYCGKNSTLHIIGTQNEKNFAVTTVYQGYENGDLGTGTNTFGNKGAAIFGKYGIANNGHIARTDMETGVYYYWDGDSFKKCDPQNHGE